jgi:DNA-binding CsgD family transcriptional regulator
MDETCAPEAAERTVAGTALDPAERTVVGVALEPAERTVASAALVGRDGELDQLARFLDEVAARGRALLLTGDAGFGKTALLEATAATASDRGLVVLRATGSEFEAELSFAALNQLLFPVLPHIEELGQAHRDALSVALGLSQGTAADQLVVSTAVLLLLCRVAADSPVLLVVDDLPWLDRASAAIISFVVRRLGGTRIGFLGAVRDDDGDFFGPHDLPRQPVAPLGEQAARTLMDLHFPALADPVRARLLAESQGNPLAILELPAALDPHQLQAGRPLPSMLPLTARLQALFAQRVRAMPKTTQQLLLVAALEGSGEPGSTPLTVVTDGSEAAEPALRAGLVRIDGRTGALTFGHPLTRSAVVGIATSAERRQAHRHLAEHFHDQPDRRAWHLAGGAEGPDEQAAALLEQMADRVLRRGDASRAVAALRRAAELSPSVADRSRRLATAHYLDVGITGDRPPTAVKSRTSVTEPRGDLYDAISTALTMVNNDGELLVAHRLLAQAITAYTGPDPAQDQAYISALLALFMLSTFASDAELWQPYHEAVARLGSQLPTDMDLLNQTGIDPVRTAAGAMNRLEAALSDLDPAKDLWHVLQISSCALYTDRIGSARPALWRIVRDGREAGAVIPAITALGHLCVDDFLRGRWEEGEQLAEEGLALSRTGGHPIQIWQAQHKRALYAAHRGQHRLAGQLADEIQAWARPRGVRQAHLAVSHITGISALAGKEFDVAFQLLSEISPPGTLPECVPYALWIPLDLVEAAVRSGHEDAAAAHVRALEDTEMAKISSRTALLVAGARALAAPPRESAKLFQAALGVAEAERWPFDLARIKLAHGERLRRAREHEAALRNLTEAFDVFRQLGAAPWAERAGNELRAAGSAPEQAAEPDESATPGHDPLTPMEREVALMAAAGMTNREIGQRLYMSHRTVGAHLYHVFPKLGISSRAALRDALSQHPDETAVPSP